MSSRKRLYRWSNPSWHLHGSHTGASLNETVIRGFQEHGIIDRVLSITENASNNNTMIQGFQDMVQSQALSKNLCLPSSMYCSYVQATA
jgi:hypothetical protein